MENQEAKDIVIDVLLNMPARHHITDGKIEITYSGSAYNNALHCFSAHFAKAVAVAVRSATAAKDAEITAAHDALRDMPTEPFRSVGDHTLPLAERIKNVEGMWRVEIRDGKAKDAEIVRLREKMEPIVAACEAEFVDGMEGFSDSDTVMGGVDKDDVCSITFGMIRSARQALTQGETTT